MKFPSVKRRIVYPPLLRTILAPVHRYLNRNAYYPQQTDFTCGPACLLMIMQQFNRRLHPTHIDELQIWREANTVFMGEEPPPGCSAQGLAAAAMRRGLQADVHDYFSIVPIAGEMPEHETAVLNGIIAADADDLVKLGGSVRMLRPGLDTITAALRIKNTKIILLVDEFEEGGLHWVVLDHLMSDEQDVVVLDPWCRRRTAREKGQIVPLTILQRLFQLGPQKCGAMVILRPQEKK